MKLLGLGGFQSEASTVPIRDKAIQTVVKENRAVPEVAVRECVNLDGIAAEHVAFVRLTVAELRAV